MYADDPFFSLSQTGQVGLVLLSTVLYAGSLAVLHYAGRGLSLPRVAGLAIFGFWLFEWLSPQIYYTYYWFYFDGLPIQSVIQLPPSPQRLFRLLLFSYEPTLSAHSRGLLGWSLIAVSFWRWKTS